VCLIDEEKGQIGRSNVVADTGDDGNAGSTAQPACGLRGTPPSAIVYAVPEFIWGMSVKDAEMLDLFMLQNENMHDQSLLALDCRSHQAGSRVKPVPTIKTPDGEVECGSKSDPSEIGQQ
jgi:hypothetical protein